MKRFLLFFIIGATLLCHNSSQAVGELGELGGANSNPHNLSSLSTGDNSDYRALTETQICIFCHTPHGATPQSTLWSRPDPQGMGFFPIRAGLGIDDDPGIVSVTRYSNTYSASGDYPNGASKLCLSCHDGVTAMGILANNEEIDMTTPPTLSANFDIDLSISHPISFVYTTAVRDYLNTLVPGSYTLTAAAYLDGDSRVQCTSCHQPHQDTRGIGTNLPFWRVGTGNRATDYAPVCVSCHVGSPPGTPPPLPGGGPEHQYNP